MQLGRVIRNLLERKNLSQKQLAEMTHISYKTLNGYLNDIRQPDLDTLVLLADALDVSVDTLLSHTTMQNSTLSELERELVRDYRALSLNQQELIQMQIRTMLKQNARLNTISVAQAGCCVSSLNMLSQKPRKPRKPK